MLNTVFEKENCTRCGGSGSYSFNMIDGSRCYGCAGMGERLTKRGKAAREMFQSLCSVEAQTLKAGDTVVYDNKRRALQEVTAGPAKATFGTYQVGYEDRVVTRLSFKAFTAYVGADEKIFKVQDENTRQQFLNQALDYQNTLTKTGKPRKV